MGSIRARPESRKLFLDFRFRGVRCRELTDLVDGKENRARLGRLLAVVEREIAQGIFDYRRHFPNSANAARFDASPTASANSARAGMAQSAGTTLTTAPQMPVATATPTFSAFAETWFKETRITWRASYVTTVRDILDVHLLPHFGAQQVGAIRRSDILQFRSTVAEKPGRSKGRMLSPARVNTVMVILRQILTEAADRYEFSSPHRRIKPLKVPKSDVMPFTPAEVEKILNEVRADYRDYYLVRFFSGMRTGEIDGLKWKYIDFGRRLILIRESVVAGRDEYTKTDSSQRDIQMSQPVFDALKRQHDATSKVSDYVFCNTEGKPLEHNNVTKRVWYPLLRHLNLAKRRPYQSRHTAATLWLAAGENPEWVANQLGHANTQMLFTIYSRFIPNITRRDGSAFERLVMATIPGAACQPD